MKYYIKDRKKLERIPTPNVTKNQISLLRHYIKIYLLKQKYENKIYQKNNINKFFQHLFSEYKDIKGNKKIDGMIYQDGKLRIIVVSKSLSDKSEFPQDETLKSQAISKALRYYYKLLRSDSINYIILATPHIFYVIDGKDFAYLSKNIEILKIFWGCSTQKQRNKKFDDKFLKIYDNIDFTLPYFKLDMTDNSNENMEFIYKCLHPSNLLKVDYFLDKEMSKTHFYVNDGMLNRQFYDELLYILGLEEVAHMKQIRIKPNYIENTFSDMISKTFNLDIKKDFKDIYSLIITWNSRILFIWALKSILLSFKHKTSIEICYNFTELYELCFKVLTKNSRAYGYTSRPFHDMPYLNSSLFKRTSLEREGKDICLLDGDYTRYVFSSKSNVKKTKVKHNSIFKTDSWWKIYDSFPFLEYLFRFLRMYAHSTIPNNLIYKTDANNSYLINANAIGLIFERMHSYKDGSLTHKSITNNMCKISIEKIVLDKFNQYFSIKESNGFRAKNIDELKDKLRDFAIDSTKLKEANDIFLSISICDPSFGSGQFLISALNEMMRIKCKLGLLIEYDSKKPLKDIDICVENDETIIKYRNEIFSYEIPSSYEDTRHIIQKSIFHTKKDIIEHSLFGINIDADSCEIVKLRLWIELLKYSYYVDISKKELISLPDMDQNIKCGDPFRLRYGIPKVLQNKGNFKGFDLVISNITYTWYNMRGRENIESISKNYKIYANAHFYKLANSMLNPNGILSFIILYNDFLYSRDLPKFVLQNISTLRHENFNDIKVFDGIEMNIEDSSFKDTKEYKFDSYFQTKKEKYYLCFKNSEMVDELESISDEIKSMSVNDDFKNRCAFMFMHSYYDVYSHANKWRSATHDVGLKIITT